MCWKTKNWQEHTFSECVGLLRADKNTRSASVLATKNWQEHMFSECVGQLKTDTNTRSASVLGN